LLTLVCAFAAGTQAAVTPETFTGTIKRGQSASVAKTVDVPDVPRRLDMLLLVDNTGSYADDLPNIKSRAGDIFDAVRLFAPAARFGLATHVDYPFAPWGAAGEYAYRLAQTPTADRSTWLDAIDSMETLYGADEPESQYEALYQAATGAGRELPGAINGTYLDPGEILPGQDAGFELGTTKVIVQTTDASFHDPGDTGGPFPYPGPSRDETVAALKDRGIRVVGLKAPGAGAQLDDVAAATGGEVVETSATSEKIAEAILGGIRGFTYDVTPHAVGCDPLQVTFDPARREGVTAPATVTFTETITVPGGVHASDLPSDRTVHCLVQFRASGTLIGTQFLHVTVKLGIQLQQPCVEQRGTIRFTNPQCAYPIP
jgi:hypothetical protein